MATICRLGDRRALPQCLCGGDVATSSLERTSLQHNATALQLPKALPLNQQDGEHFTYGSLTIRWLLIRLQLFQSFSLILRTHSFRKSQIYSTPGLYRLGISRFLALGQEFRLSDAWRPKRCSDPHVPH